MKLCASIFLVLAVWLAVLLGVRLSPWAWGGSLVALGVAVVAVLPGIMRGDAGRPGWWLLGVGVVTVVWFAMRAWLSPVAEHGLMDLLLLGAVVGGLVVMRVVQRDLAAERVVVWGLGLLLFANAVVVIRQAWDPGFSPGLVGRFHLPSGFFGHYNYAANFQIATSCLLGGAAIFGVRFHRLERGLLGLVALVGMGSIYLTGSRGGQLGAAAALAVLVALVMMGGVKRGAKWFAPLVIALPVVGIGLAAFLMFGWGRAQESRGVDRGVDQLMDNTTRLHLAGIALSCVAEHPWEGGGSRSFSWECNRFWDIESHGHGGNRPEQVHNELLQAASDYGIIGAGLLLLLLGSVMVGGVVGAMLDERGAVEHHEDSWRLGGLAGLAGLLVQSNFSFVFHLLPGPILLGLCLARAVQPGMADRREGMVGPAGRWLTGFCAVACAALILPLGWRGVRVTAVRWADSFAKPPQRGDEALLHALTKAIAIWPLEEFHLERATIYQKQAVAVAGSGMAEELTRLAIADYTSASAIHPFDPTPVVNRAVLLGVAGEDATAEAEFGRAIQLQGGMETAYRSWHLLAGHYFRKSVGQLRDGDANMALGTIDLAVSAMEKAVAQSPLWVIDRELRLAIYERRGLICGLLGDEAGALAAYDFMDTIATASRGNYRAARLLMQRGNRVWLERKPAEALAAFLRARQRFSRAGSFPEETSMAERNATWEYLNEKITDLQAAKIEPAGADAP